MPSSSILVLRETLLGALKARLEDPKVCKLHASDFHTACDQLGLRFGTKDLDDIMVMCRISEDGYVDFSSFHSHVLDSRVLAKQGASVADPLASRPPSRASSSSAPIQPLRPSDAHKLLKAAEEQSQLVRLKENEIRALFHSFDRAEKKDTAKFKSDLEALGIKITADAHSLLRRSEATETSLTALLRALTVADRPPPPLSGDVLVMNVTGGGSSSSPDPHNPNSRLAGGRRVKEEGEFGSRKRTDPRRAASVLAATSGREDAENSAIGARGTGSRKGKFFSSSEGVKGTLDMGAGATLSTTTQASNAVGVGAEVNNASGFNCEQKMLRQQIFSLVRKMDDNEITAREFQDKLFTMGFEIPTPVLQLLKNFDASGKANFKQFIQAFERYFEQRSSESSVKPEQIQALTDKLLEMFKEKGAGSISTIAKIFDEFDDDGSGTLSLSEFKKGIATFGLDIDPNDLRMIFNSFDKNGDGSLDVQEFVVALRGEMPTSRIRLVRQAFTTLDKAGIGKISRENMAAKYQPLHHPDVMDGSLSEDDALDHLLSSMDAGERDGLVDIDEFFNYYKNMSATIDDDAVFEQMLRTAWELDVLPPPPAAYVRGRDGKLFTKPLAGQDHGNIVNWNQQPSALESREQPRKERARPQGMKVDFHSMQNHDVNGWIVDPTVAARALKQEQDSLFGGRSRQHFNGNDGARKVVEQSTNILSWETHQKSTPPPKAPASRNEKDEYVWFAGHQKKPAANSLHFGRPSPFGVDEEPTAYKLSQDKQQGGKSPEKTKPKIQSLADLMNN